MKIIDAHSHIDYITHKQQCDVVGTVCCCVDESQWNVLIDMANQDDKIFPCFGVHPWFVNSVKEDFDKRLQEILLSDSHYMIGEIGLDKYKPNMEKQIDVFIKQFDLAVRFNKSVFIHCVGVWDKMLHILKQYKKSKLPMIVVHGFNGNDDILQQLMRYQNVYFSFNKNAVYDRNCRIQEIDANRILVETDGKQDAVLKDIIESIVKIKDNIDIPNVIYDNIQRVLKNGQIA